jgi:hypothetical protein
MRAPLLVSLLLFAACARELPTEPLTGKSSVASDAASSSGRRRAATAPATGACATIAGTYDVRYEAACPNSNYPETWELQQAGCDFHTPLYPDMPATIGTVDAGGVSLKMRNGFIACEYQLEGRGTIANGVITATLTGPTSGPCCGTTTETVHLVATRR